MQAYTADNMPPPAPPLLRALVESSPPAASPAHDLPDALWRYVGALVGAEEMVADDNNDNHDDPSWARLAALGALRLVNRRVRDAVATRVRARHVRAAATRSGEAAAPAYRDWPMARWDAEEGASRCEGCGVGLAAAAPPVQLRWEVVRSGGPNGLRRVTNYRRTARACAACTERCTLDTIHARRVLMWATVRVDVLGRTAREEDSAAVDGGGARDGGAQAQDGGREVVLFDRLCRYWRADIARHARARMWHSSYSEHVQWTSRREGIVTWQPAAASRAF